MLKIFQGTIIRNLKEKFDTVLQRKALKKKLLSTHKALKKSLSNVTQLTIT